MEKKNNKVGILGGTFDPPHKGHLYISKIALKKLKLKKIIWVVTNQNPLKKKPYLSINNRLKLSKLITNGQNKILIKNQNNIIKSKNTFSLLKKIKSNNKKIKLFFLIGADNLVNFHKWYKWKAISSKCNILVFDRKNYKSKSLKSKAFKKLNSKELIFIKFKKINISSSKLRKI